LILLLLSFCLSSQVNLIYFNSEIPQSNYLNPALNSRCKVVVGIPALNGIGIGIAHNGFTFKQMFKENNGVLTPDPEGLLKKLGRRNYVQMDLEISDLFIGMKIKKYYFNFSVRERIRANVFYNKDMLRLGIEGNTPFEGEWASLTGSGLSATYFRQYTFGVAYPLQDYLTVGLHLNLLFGKAGVYGNPASTGLFTDEETFALTLNTDVTGKASLPVVLNFNNSGELVYQEVDQSIPEFILNRKNKGLSIDAGFVYETEKDLTLYGSILDLGFIRYTSNTTIYTAEGEFNYNGPSENEYLNSNYLYELVNALDDSIDVSLNHEKYAQFLPMKIYFGGQRDLTDNLKAGMLINANIFRQKAKTYVGIHAGYQLGKHINTMMNWSFSSRSIKNIGLGFSFDFHPVHFYIAGDNAIGYFLGDKILGNFWLRNTKNVNLQFGFNLKFGCREKGDSGDGYSHRTHGCSWMDAPKSYQKLIKKR